MVSYYRAQLCDVETVTSLRLEVLEIFEGVQPPEIIAGLLPQLRDTIASGLSDNTYLCWLAEKNGETIAAGGMAVRRQPGNFKNPTGRTGYIMSMYTRPGYRGDGICSELVRRLIGSARDMGIEHFELHATKDGEPIYKNLGFLVHNEPTYRKNEAITEK